MLPLLKSTYLTEKKKTCNPPTQETSLEAGMEKYFFFPTEVEVKVKEFLSVPKK